MSDYGSDADLRGKRKNEAGEPIDKDLEALVMGSNLPAQIKISVQKGLYLGQRFFREYVENIGNTAVLTGFKPTSRDENSGMHMGHKFIVDTLVALQQSGSQVYIAIADEEAKLTGGHELERSKKIAAQYLLDMGALGLNLDNTYIYLQSEEPAIKNTAAALKDSLGGTENPNVAKHYNYSKKEYIEAGFNQAGDIYLPQVLTGPKRVLVPCGPDQETHLDFAIKYVRLANTNFLEPVPLYSGHIGSLKHAGMKMNSSKDGEYAIFLVDDPSRAEKLIRSLDIVPQEIAEQLQLKLQGRLSDAGTDSLNSLIEKNSGKVINALNPEINPIVDLLKYHFTSGQTELIGLLKKSPEEQKEYVAHAVQQFLAEHQKRRSEVLAYVRGEAGRPTFWSAGGVAPQVSGENRTDYRQIILSAAK